MIFTSVLAKAFDGGPYVGYIENVGALGIVGEVRDWIKARG